MILNLTQHQATADQQAAGVADIDPKMRPLLLDCLNFEEIPSFEDLDLRADVLVVMSDGYDAVMIGGAPFLMPILQHRLQQAGKRVLYAFSKRESLEQTQPDGSVKKVAVFRHSGFVDAV